MSGDEDTLWLDALAGRISDPSQAWALEALLLRTLIQTQTSEIACDIPSADAQREQELIRRARAEGLLPGEVIPGPTVGSAPSQRRRRFVDTRFQVAAAAMVVIAAGIGIWHATLVPTETLRGTLNGIVHLEARDPRALERQLTEELHAVGVQVSGYERLGRIGMDAELPQPVSQRIVEILQRHHIPVPTDGALTVEIDAPHQ
jgi:hypothetical protein